MKNALAVGSRGTRYARGAPKIFAVLRLSLKKTSLFNVISQFEAKVVTVLCY